jgi:membrane protein DedA with SNARE-associated domain
VSQELNAAIAVIGIEYLFLRHGGKIVFFGRFIAILRTYSAILAGANCMPWPHFLVMNACGGIGWACVFSTAAYLFGEQATRVSGSVSTLLVAGAAGAIIAGIVYFRHHQDELVRRAEAALPGPV